MEYQKIVNLLDETTNQSSIFRTRWWVELNIEWIGKNDNSNIKFKTSMIRSKLCDYSDAYIPVKETIEVLNRADYWKKKINNCASFTNCATEINNTQVDDAQDIDIVIPMYNLIKYSDAYWQTSGSL